MKVSYYQNPERLKIPIPLSYQPIVKGGRTFTVSQDINIVLSDGYEITISEGTLTDLSSVPKFLWSLLSPIDEAFIGDLIHDYLWENKKEQMERFGYSSYLARKFADDERNKWRKKIAPNKKFKNWITHRFLRLLGGLWYSRQLQIPT